MPKDPQLTSEESKRLDKLVGNISKLCKEWKEVLNKLISDIKKAAENQKLITPEMTKELNQRIQHLFDERKKQLDKINSLIAEIESIGELRI